MQGFRVLVEWEKRLFSETASGKAKWVFSCPIHKTQGQIHQLFYGLYYREKKIHCFYLLKGFSFQILGEQRMFDSEGAGYSCMWVKKRKIFYHVNVFCHSLENTTGVLWEKGVPNKLEIFIGQHTYEREGKEKICKNLLCARRCARKFNIVT